MIQDPVGMVPHLTNLIIDKFGLDQKRIMTVIIMHWITKKSPLFLVDKSTNYKG